MCREQMSFSLFLGQLHHGVVRQALALVGQAVGKQVNRIQPLAAELEGGFEGGVHVRAALGLDGGEGLADPLRARARVVVEPAVSPPRRYDAFTEKTTTWNFSSSGRLRIRRATVRPTSGHLSGAGVLSSTMSMLPDISTRKTTRRPVSSMPAKRLSAAARSRTASVCRILRVVLRGKELLLEGLCPGLALPPLFAVGPAPPARLPASACRPGPPPGPCPVSPAPASAC